MRPSQEELDLHIQFSLVARIRQAAKAYRATPAAVSPPAMAAYVCALESLAEYVTSKWRGSQVLEESQAPRVPIRINRSARVVSLPPPEDSGDATPLTAA